MSNITLIHHKEFSADEYYESADGRYTVRRESRSKTPNGNPMNNRWAFRDTADGGLIDFDKYRHDLFERNDLTIA